MVFHTSLPTREQANESFVMTGMLPSRPQTIDAVLMLFPLMQAIVPTS